ncbi:MAG TPA: hypothetical protein VHU88_06700 [Sporichthyaceae bacterium]|jgi:hypothetical protein|nr:hypothetical protein [Sporichthyaceae bacterium]
MRHIEPNAQARISQPLPSTIANAAPGLGSRASRIARPSATSPIVIAQARTERAVGRRAAAEIAAIAGAISTGP